jgi:tRNA pseudouridine-54 N-methylase
LFLLTYTFLFLKEKGRAIEACSIRANPIRIFCQKQNAGVDKMEKMKKGKERRDSAWR